MQLQADPALIIPDDRLSILDGAIVAPGWNSIRSDGISRMYFEALAKDVYKRQAFFPENAVEYFVSYYDYYQPEAYIPHTDTFIEKDSAINEEIDRLRLSATASLLERRDVIVVSSVSCIYGLGEPADFASMMVSLRVGATLERDELLKKLVAIRY